MIYVAGFVIIYMSVDEDSPIVHNMKTTDADSGTIARFNLNGGEQTILKSGIGHVYYRSFFFFLLFSPCFSCLNFILFYIIKVLLNQSGFVLGH